jgi:two-component system sensor histidine kinase CreC
VRIRTRIFLAFAPVLIAGFYLLLSWILRDIRPQPLKAMEESLVDTAHILAAMLEGRAAVDGVPDPTDLRAVMDRAARRQFSATIYELSKSAVNLRVYVTDRRGIVVFDSDGGKAEGQDYSRWNDVYLTLHGRYGARATRTVPGDFYSTVIYVAAPVVVEDRIIGAVTVAKPTESVKLFISRTSEKVMLAGLIVGLAVGLVSLLLAHWLTRPIKRLTAYAVAVRNGLRTALPDLGRGEMAVMGKALEEMRDALEGKQYIEEYVQALTHEIKSPLTSIRGAAELLQEEMTPESRARFLGNIQRESQRLQELVDRLLMLAQLETRKGLATAADVDLAAIAGEAAADAGPQVEQKGLAVHLRVPPGLHVRGEPFLLRLAVGNLLQNAVDFSPAGGTITLTGGSGTDGVFLAVADAGPGVPDYALERVFERFYSLQRPDTRHKSSGLGLAIVREIAGLHGGAVRLENRSEGGAVATLQFPAIP